MKNILINKRNNILFITLVLLSSLSGMAQASMVYEDVGFISGTGSASDSFQISSPGRETADCRARTQNRVRRPLLAAGPDALAKGSNVFSRF